LLVVRIVKLTLYLQKYCVLSAHNNYDYNLIRLSFFKRAIISHWLAENSIRKRFASSFGYSIKKDLPLKLYQERLRLDIYNEGLNWHYQFHNDLYGTWMKSKNIKAILIVWHGAWASHSDKTKTHFKLARCDTLLSRCIKVRGMFL